MSTISHFIQEVTTPLESMYIELQKLILECQYPFVKQVDDQYFWVGTNYATASARTLKKPELFELIELLQISISRNPNIVISNLLCGDVFVPYCVHTTNNDISLRYLIIKLAIQLYKFKKTHLRQLTEKRKRALVEIERYNNICMYYDEKRKVYNFGTSRSLSYKHVARTELYLTQSLRGLVGTHIEPNKSNVWEPVKLTKFGQFIAHQY